VTARNITDWPSSDAARIDHEAGSGSTIDDPMSTCDWARRRLYRVVSPGGALKVDHVGGCRPRTICYGWGRRVTSPRASPLGRIPPTCRREVVDLPLRDGWPSSPPSWASVAECATGILEFPRSTRPTRSEITVKRGWTYGTSSLVDVRRLWLALLCPLITSSDRQYWAPNPGTSRRSACCRRRKMTRCGPLCDGTTRLT